MSAIIDRILTQLGDGALLDKLLALPKSDLNSFLLQLFEKQTNKTAPTDVVKAFEQNRFSVPSDVDPVAYHMLETAFLSSAQKNGIKPVLLSPAAPLASCSVFGCVHQNKVLSATRGTEMLSDPTNMLAIIMAAQLKNKKIDNQNPLHYCATARVLRAQAFPNTGRHFSHFGVFGLVSSGKDNGSSYLCEKELLQKHLSYYKELLVEKYDAQLLVVCKKRSGFPAAFFDSAVQLMQNTFPDVPLSFDESPDENNYYQGMQFKVYMEKEDAKIEIGDGGFVDWMQKMTGNKKERCLISGIGLDRLLLL